MSSTVVSKRCKGCCFWQPYTGNIENPVMRKLNGQQQAPARRSRACQLWLRDSGKVDDDGEPIMVDVFPVPNADDAFIRGPRYGERTGPKDTCAHHRAKNPPYRRPAPEVHIGVEHVFNELHHNIVIPASADDIKPMAPVVEMPPIAVDYIDY